MSQFKLARSRPIHIISEPYPAYTFEETEKVVASIDYPHSCATFEANNPQLCEGCRFKGQIKSPIVLGMEIREATAEDNTVYVELPNASPKPTAPNKNSELEGQCFSDW